MTQTTEFSYGDRVIVENMVNGQPGPYHGCAARVVGHFTFQGESCALVRFSNGIEKKITASKLRPADQPAPARRTERAAPLPEWAREGCRWTLGGELQAGDTIYFSAIANPRLLVEQRTPEHWTSTVIVTYCHNERRIPGQLVEVSTHRWYVVNREVG